MAKVWFLGEALIDFVPVTVNGRTTYDPCCGGSPLNAAVACARQGAATGFLGGLSTDLFGDRLADFLVARDVDIAQAERSDHPTTLAFVDLDGAEPRYAFFNRQTATALMSPNASRFRHGADDILHVGSIALIDRPGAENIRKFAEEVARGLMVSFDPNARPGMTTDPADWRARAAAILSCAGVVKLSDQDLAFLSPGEGPADFAARQLSTGTGIVVVTEGDKGAAAYTARGQVHVPARRTRLADTVGAGDTVTGTLLASLVERGCTTPAAIARLESSAVADILTRCMTAASINCEATGCNPPSRAETLKELTRA